MEFIHLANYYKTTTLHFCYSEGTHRKLGRELTDNILPDFGEILPE
jgi:hypothetical protein